MLAKKRHYPPNARWARTGGSRRASISTLASRSRHERRETLGGFIRWLQHDRVFVLRDRRLDGFRRRYRWLTPTERAAVVARFGEGARVVEVMGEFGVARTSACRIRDEAALMQPAGVAFAASVVV